MGNYGRRILDSISEASLLARIFPLSLMEDVVERKWRGKYYAVCHMEGPRKHCMQNKSRRRYILRNGMLSCLAYLKVDERFDLIWKYLKNMCVDMIFD